MNMLYIIIIAIMVWVYIYTTKDNTKILGELKWEIKKNIKNGGNVSEINEKIKILEKENKSKATWIVTIGIILMIGLLLNGASQEDSANKEKEEIRRESLTQEQKDKEIRLNRIEEQFSAWDWSHKELTKIIKASMNDPKSYEHIKTTYNDEGDSILVVTSFRWKNWFWGIVTNSMSAKFSIDGSLIEIIEPK